MGTQNFPILIFALSTQLLRILSQILGWSIYHECSMRLLPIFDLNLKTASAGGHLEIFLEMLQTKLQLSGLSSWDFIAKNQSGKILSTHPVVIHGESWFLNYHESLFFMNLRIWSKNSWKVMHHDEAWTFHEKDPRQKTIFKLFGQWPFIFLNLIYCAKIQKSVIHSVLSKHVNLPLIIIFSMTKRIFILWA